jgi:hypothetical protein
VAAPQYPDNLTRKVMLGCILSEIPMTCFN